MPCDHVARATGFSGSTIYLLITDLFDPLVAEGMVHFFVKLIRIDGDSVVVSTKTYFDTEYKANVLKLFLFSAV